MTALKMIIYMGKNSYFRKSSFFSSFKVISEADLEFKKTTKPNHCITMAYLLSTFSRLRLSTF